MDVTLTDQNGRPWSLSANLASGAVILVFYRGDW